MFDALNDVDKRREEKGERQNKEENTKEWVNKKFAKSNYKGPIGKLAFLVLIKCFRSIVTVSVSGQLHFVISGESGFTSSVIWYNTFLVNFNFTVISLVNI